MSVIRWAAVPVLAGALAGNVALAAADEPAPTPTPTPAPTPSATDPAEPTPPSVTGSDIYITTTTTTTTVNAPITVVAAPITTTTNNTTSNTTGEEAGRVVMDLTGCGRGNGGSPTATRGRPRFSRVRLARDATLVIRVNGKRITTLRLPTPSRARTVALRVRLARDGTLTVRRPSGLVLAVPACAPV